MNKVILMGRLVRDPEVRYTQGEEQKCIARYTLAVDRRLKRDSNSNGQQTADFISCISFGKPAEFMERYGKKGVKIVVEGRIQTGSYDRDGQKVYTTNVVVDLAEFAESKGNTSPSEAPEKAAESDGFMNIPDGIDEELPFN